MADAGHLLSLFWTPIVSVTAAVGGRRSGQIAVSVHGASIVPQRPRLTIGLWKGNLTHELVGASGACAVHLLRADQDQLVYHLGMRSGYDLDKLATLEHSTGDTGAPLLGDCLAVFECRVLNRMDAGDHTVFLAEIVRSEIRGDGDPLWWRDLRARMPADKRAAWDVKSARDAARALRIMDDIKRLR